MRDDSEIVLEVRRTALRATGYDVVCAQDRAQLAEARETRADLVLIDVHMPEAFGHHVTMTLRHAYGIAAPICLLSSLEEGDLADRVEWAGIDGSISKHLGIDAIITRVRDILPSDA